jgi:hypothetical protein
LRRLPQLSLTITRLHNKIIDYWTQPQHAKELEEKQQAGDKVYSEYVVSGFKDNDLAADMFVLVNFFKNLHACTCRKLCDDDLVKEFFQTTAWDLNGLANPFIDDQRHQPGGDPTFGSGLVDLAATYTKVPDFQKTYCDP